MNTFTQHAPDASATTRAAQKLETRGRILAAARAHFEAHGFEGANVRAIAEAAGVAAGTVLLHFADKRDLLHAALFDDLAATLAAAVAAPRRGRLELRLHRVLEPVFAYYAQRPTLSRALLRESLLADPPWQQRFAAQAGELHAHVVRSFEEARARGEIAADGDAALFGVAFLSFYYFALLAWAQGTHPAPLALVDRLISQHLAGLRPTKRAR